MSYLCVCVCVCVCVCARARVLTFENFSEEPLHSATYAVLLHFLFPANCVRGRLVCYTSTTATTTRGSAVYSASSSWSEDLVETASDDGRLVVIVSLSNDLLRA